MSRHESLSTTIMSEYPLNMASPSTKSLVWIGVRFHFMGSMTFGRNSETPDAVIVWMNDLRFMVLRRQFHMHKGS